MKIAIFWIAMLQASVAFAWSGNELYDKLKSKDPSENIAGYAYVQGIIETETFHYYEFSKNNKNKSLSSNFVCLPDGVTVGQASDMVKKFMEDYPQLRHHPASANAITALRAVWRCEN